MRSQQLNRLLPLIDCARTSHVHRRTQPNKNRVRHDPEPESNGDIKQKVLKSVPSSTDHLTQFQARETDSQIRQPKKHQLRSHRDSVKNNVAKSLCELTLLISAAVGQKQHCTGERKRIAVLP